MTRKKLIEKIVNITMPYCDNCRHDMEDECCEDCHIKYMMWEYSDDVADEIINKLLILSRRAGYERS